MDLYSIYAYRYFTMNSHQMHHYFNIIMQLLLIVNLLLCNLLLSITILIIVAFIRTLIDLDV